jgi:polyhydroxybutyrate depolymerase
MRNVRNVTAHDTHRFLLASALGLSTLVGCGRGDTKFGNVGGGSDPGYVEGSLVVEGRPRIWHLRIPTASREGRPLALVIALHGGGGVGAKMNQLTGLDAIAEREGFFLVYPEGVDRSWNDGRADAQSVAAREEIGDVAFLSALIDELARTYLVDKDRVFATGISNGAMMSCRLACELADKIAAVALVAGAMPRSIAPSCAPSRPVSILMMFGTEDPIVPFGGGEVKIRNSRARGMVISAPATVDAWVRLDGCVGAPEEHLLADSQKADGSTVTVHTWSHCNQGSGVDFYEIKGGGHTWPGGWQYLSEAWIGTTNRDIDAREVIWRFFSTHPKTRT